MADPVRISTFDISEVDEKLDRLLQRLNSGGGGGSGSTASGRDFDDFMGDVGQYMVNSTINRILRTKTSPSGERWPGLAELTIDLKGHDKELFDSGELSRSIVSTQTNDEVEISSSLHYAEYMQEGVDASRHRGRVWNAKRGWTAKPYKGIPARPFLGFSEANIKRISKMLKEHLEQD